jgi:hypothetical protein
MIRTRAGSLTILVIALTCAAGAATIGQVDTFQSGTVEGWVAGGGPNGQLPPVPPHVQLSGGPAGLNDAFLLITSFGGGGPGSRLTAFNINGQWADNYLTNGINGISMDLNNLGSTELTIRLEFENPFSGGDEAVTNIGIVLPAASGWVHAVLPVGLNALTALEGSVAGALGNTTVLRILHAPGITDAVPVAGLLGVDNITALGTPEPATNALSGIGLVMLGLAARAVRSRVR